MSGPISSRVHQVAQRADDLDRAIAFYREVLGLPLVARLDPPGLAFFQLGTTRLLLERDGSSALLYLEVDDIGAARARLVAAAVAFEDEPHPIFTDTEGMFGIAGATEWMTFLRDSEGNLLALVERRVER